MAITTRITKPTLARRSLRGELVARDDQSLPGKNRHSSDTNEKPRRSGVSKLVGVE
ncbi:hypothetical protein ACC671_05180 [Rhizobium ruizarguesonis]